MLLVNTYQWEWTTIAAMIAPRPLLFANSDKDPIFPMDGNRRIIARLRDCYKLLGAPDLVDEYVSAGGHDYRPDLRVAIFKFINKHLKKDNGAVKDADFKPLPGKELRVFADDGDLPKDAINAKIDETFVAAKRPKLPEEARFNAWRIEQMGEIYKNLGPIKRLGFAKKIDVKIKSVHALTADNGVPFTVGAVRNGNDGNVTTLLVLGPDDDPEELGKEWERWIKESNGLWPIVPRGGGKLSWTKKSPPNYVERSLALVGETIDQGRLVDVMAAARAWREMTGKSFRLRVLGKGHAGIVAAYAAFLEKEINEVVVINPPTSHRDGPHFPNVMRTLDIPDALGLLAPRPLTIIGGKDKAFDRTAEIYKLAGAADKLKRE
jgi:hypothetical protein